LVKVLSDDLGLRGGRRGRGEGEEGWRGWQLQGWMPQYFSNMTYKTNPWLHLT